MKSGFVCVAGAPSVGKSTLVNAFVGEKVSIVSEKPGTTRNRINAILTLEEAQVVFVDTPGIHKPLHKIGKYLFKIAVSALEGNDLVLFIVSATRIGSADRTVAQKIKELKTPVIGVVNKIDVANESYLKEARSIFNDLNVRDVFEISALQNKGTNNLLKSIISLLPEGPKYYPDDIITDRPTVFMVSEIIREKIFELTHEEIPYSSAVEIDQIEENEEITKIYATIFVEKDSQRGIVLGKGGKMIKQIGILARKDIEYLLDSHVFLSLHVKVKTNWTEDDKILGRMFKEELN